MSVLANLVFLKYLLKSEGTIYKTQSKSSPTARNYFVSLMFAIERDKLY